MAYSKARQILISEARKIKSKADQKRREADKLDDEVKEIYKQIDKLSI